MSGGRKELFIQAAVEVDKAAATPNLIGACTALVRARRELNSPHNVFPTSSILKKMMRPSSLEVFWLGRLNEKNRQRRIYCLLLAAEAWRDFE